MAIIEDSPSSMSITLDAEPSVAPLNLTVQLYISRKISAGHTQVPHKIKLKEKRETTCEELKGCKRKVSKK